MKFELTKRDKKLLLYSLCVLIVVLIYQILLLPCARHKQDLRLELEEAKFTLEDMEQTLRLADHVEESLLSEEAELSSNIKGFPQKLLATREMDKIITDLLLQYSLFPTRLDLTDPVQELPLPYGPALPPEENAEGAASNPEKAPPAKLVHNALITLNARAASEQECFSFLDAVSQKPFLHIVHFDIANEEVVLNSTQLKNICTLNCQIQILMCAEEEQAQ